MSFLNPDKDQTGSPKIYTRTYTWSGGEKAINPNDPTQGKKAYAEIRYYEGSGQSSIKGKLDEPRMRLAVIGQTFSVNGFDSQGTPGSNVSYFSNETTTWGQTLKVYKRDARGTEPVENGTGTYKQVKNVLGKLIKCQHNVYFYDFDRKCIDRFTFSGSSYGAWTDFKKMVGKDVYTGAVIVEPGKAGTFPTGVTITPQFTLPRPYTEAERAEVAEVATKMEEYEAYLDKRANDIAGDNDSEDVDQTPYAYDGEQSQEMPDASTAPENTTDLGDAPF